MNPLFLAAIRATQRAMDDIRHDEHNQSYPSSEQHQRQHRQTVPMHPSVFQRLISWLQGKKK